MEHDDESGGGGVSGVPWYDEPLTGEEAKAALLRARIVLAHRQAENVRLAEELEATGLTSFADQADWLFEQRPADEKRAWRRRWAALGLTKIAPDIPDRPMPDVWVACSRCGIPRVGNESRPSGTGLCRDCSSSMTREERALWAA